MAVHEAVDGIVIRVRDSGERDRYLTVLTAEHGRMTLLSKGSHSLKGSQMAISQLYTYANFEYYKKGDFCILKGGSPIQPFYGISTDMDRLNLAAYLCDAAYEMSDEGERADTLLRMLLNALYAISRELYPQQIIKGAFELRAAGISGYTPELAACAHCQNDRAAFYYLDVMNGALLCEGCLASRGKKATLSPASYDEIREAELLLPISPSVLAAIRYCIEAPMERLFSFELSDAEELLSFAKSAETYLLSHLGRGFDSLEFYHSMRDLSPQKRNRT